MIEVPPQFKARPTTDFAKEALFNILDNEYEWEDLKVLDLFGGTGSISFEFISRGVGSVHCVEMNPQYASFIRTQAQRLGLRNLTVIHHNVFDFLPICQEKFHIIFADPPYALEGLENIPDKVLSQDILHPDMYFILEHGDEHTFAGHPNFVKEKHYGRVHFSFFTKG